MPPILRSVTILRSEESRCRNHVCVCVYLHPGFWMHFQRLYFSGQTHQQTTVGALKKTHLNVVYATPICKTSENYRCKINFDQKNTGLIPLKNESLQGFVTFPMSTFLVETLGSHLPTTEACDNGWLDMAITWKIP